MSAAADARAPEPPRDHLVCFYDHDAELVAALADYVAEGLSAGDGVVVVATPAHRALLEQVLAQRGVDPRARSNGGRLVSLDAAATMATFCTDGGIDADLFAATIGAILDAAGTEGQPVRVFGEMVAVLWDEGDVTGALELEELWNGLAAERPFTLLCAYPTSALREPYDLHSGHAVCVLHSELMTPNSYLADLATLGLHEGDRRRTEVFLPVPAAVRAVRHFVRATLLAWGQPALVQDALVVVSELASNALRHARTPFRVALAQHDGWIRVAVEDVEGGQPTARSAAEDDEHGRGMAIVAALARAWGTEQAATSKVVWAELPAGDLPVG